MNQIEEKIMLNKKNKDKNLEMLVIPPHDDKLEEYLLGTIIVFPEYFPRIANYFNPDLFYKENNKTIATAIANLFKKDIMPDLVTVCTECKKISNTVSPYDISVLINPISSGVNIENYYLILIELFIKRKLINISYEYMHKCSKDSEDALKLLDGMLEDVSALVKHTQVKKSLSINEIINNIEEDFSKLDGNKNNYYTLGIEELDNLLYLSKGDFICVAGDTGSGKTKIMTQLMKNLVFLNEDVSILWFSFEDDRRQIVKNMVSDSVGLTAIEMDNKGFEMNDFSKNLIMKSWEKLKEKDIVIESQPCTVNTIKNTFLAFCKARPNKFNVLLIDNIMQIQDNVTANNQTKIDDYIMNELKSLSLHTKDYNSAIFYLHHIGKSENLSSIKNGYRIHRDQIRGSKRFIDYATTVLIINKPSTYPDLVSMYSDYEEMINHLLILSVEKNRANQKGDVRLFMDMSINYLNIIKD